MSGDVYQRLSVVIEADELDGGYVVSCAELPGCWSQGESLAEAAANFAEALAAVLEVRDRPLVADSVQVAGPGPAGLPRGRARAGGGGGVNIEELRELERKATPGPWVDAFEVIEHADDGGVDLDVKNASLVVAARNALPVLLDVAEAALVAMRDERVGVVEDDFDSMEDLPDIRQAERKLTRLRRALAGLENA